MVENYHDIKTPVLAVSGWADGIPRPCFAWSKTCKLRVKVWLGPWGHKYPHQGVPGPAIGFLEECKQWWDRWLKDIPNDVENLPDLRVFLQHPAKPKAHFDQRHGRWLGIKNWPSEKVKPEYFQLEAGKLVKGAQQPPAHAFTIQSPQTTGTAAESGLHTRD